MRQFGVVQDIPLWSIMGLHKDAFTSVLLERIRNLQVKQEYMIDLNMGEESWCTPEYYAWLTIVSHMVHPSVRGLWGFVDNQRIDWIVPRSIDYLIHEAEKEEEENSEENPEEDPEEDPKEDPKKDPEEDPEEDPKEDPKKDPEEDLEEEVEKDHMEVYEMGSDIYNPRDRGLIDMSPKNGPEESPEYHPGPYYDVDDAPTWS
ncbi:hypothetical protein H5410_050582 [Solanum commersonii]|uniref:Uncharacterized protein n=1 Tax=Solanum commersonii TaxID=4109 RepID=A0A9J5WVW1_SOLCO|nr:hypothetical protein H5410_050582 [Solanum commersonii]